LTDTKLGAEGRKDLFDWLSKQLAGVSDFSDAVYLLKPACSAMTVRIYEGMSNFHSYILFFCFVPPFKLHVGGIFLRINRQMFEKRQRHALMKF